MNASLLRAVMLPGVGKRSRKAKNQSLRLLWRKRPDTVGEITIRRQKPLVLRIMVEQGRTMILFLSGLTPRCEQIFPHRCYFSQSGEFANGVRSFSGQSIAHSRPSIPAQHRPADGEQAALADEVGWAVKPFGKSGLKAASQAFRPPA